MAVSITQVLYPPHWKGNHRDEVLGEFKELINRGNVMDLAVAVAVIIGGAFTSIVTGVAPSLTSPQTERAGRSRRFFFLFLLSNLIAKILRLVHRLYE